MYIVCHVPSASRGIGTGSRVDRAMPDAARCCNRHAAVRPPPPLLFYFIFFLFPSLLLSPFFSASTSLTLSHYPFLPLRFVLPSCPVGHCYCHRPSRCRKHGTFGTGGAVGGTGVVVVVEMAGFLVARCRVAFARGQRGAQQQGHLL